MFLWIKRKTRILKFYSVYMQPALGFVTHACVHFWSTLLNWLLVLKNEWTKNEFINVALRHEKLKTTYFMYVYVETVSCYCFVYIYISHIEMEMIVSKCKRNRKNMKTNVISISRKSIFSNSRYQYFLNKRYIFFTIRNVPWISEYYYYYFYPRNRDSSFKMQGGGGDFFFIIPWHSWMWF